MGVTAEATAVISPFDAAVEPSLPELAVEIGRLIEFAAIAVAALQSMVAKYCEEIDARLRQPEVRESIRTIVRRAQALDRAADDIRSPGYAPYFEDILRKYRSEAGQALTPANGMCLAKVARLQVLLIRALVPRLREDLKDEARVGRLLRLLASRPATETTRLAIRLSHEKEAFCLLHWAFRRADLEDFRTVFSDLVDRAAAGDVEAGETLRRISQDLQEFVPEPGGPRPSDASLQHWLFLNGLSILGYPRRYTISDQAPLDRNGNSECGTYFLDEATQAARLEFKNPKFDPRPAARSLHTRLGKNRCRPATKPRKPPS